MARVTVRSFVPRYEALIWDSYSGRHGITAEYEFLDRAEDLNREVLRALSPEGLERVKRAAWARYERKMKKGRTGP